MRPIQLLTSASSCFFGALHIFHWDSGQLGGIVIGVFQDRQAAQDFSRLQHLPSDAADHMLQAELVGIGVVALRAREFA